MAYRKTSKRNKLWSINANAAKERKRMESDYVAPVDIDPYFRIEIERRVTGEKAVFECFEGDRIDNYRVYCNGDFKGVQSITTITKNIRKAIPSFKREL